MPNDILAEIVAHKRTEIAGLLERADREDWRGRAYEAADGPDFLAALTAAPGIAVIAEIKKASPSAGVLRPDFDPVALARGYERGGAACLSVLTDNRFFGGSIEDLRQVRAAVALPLLRKDFLLDSVQLYEAKLAGAAAVLLIAECLDAERLASMVRLARELQMTALVELYDAANLPMVLDSGARLLGVNNRNLRTFEIRLDHTLELLERIPKDRVVVSESGIRTRADVDRLRQAGVEAILVGEAFMRADDPGAELALWIGRGD